MANCFDNTPFQTGSPQPSYNAQDFQQMFQQARQNPQAFEAMIRQTNPAAYQQAMQIRNSANPRALIMQMAQSKGLNSNMLRMLGIM